VYSPALSICCEMFFPLSRLAAQTRPAARVGWRQASTGQPGPALVFVEGVRTPFLASLTTFEQMMPHQLLAAAMAGLLQRTGLSPHQVDYLCAGTVQQEVRTSNVTKEAAFLSGFPLSTPGHTVTMACISANQAVTTCMGLLATGQAELCIAGGVEFCSDQPIRYPRLVRQMLMKAPRARSAAAQAEVGRRMLEFGPASLAPEIPDPREFSTAEVMGHSADRLCEVWGVGRQDQDEFGLRSHQLAAAAQEAGLLSDIVPVTVPGLGEPVDRDNGIRPATMEKLAKLKPAFRKGGTVTAANSSFLSDGATACMITTEEKAKQLGLKPKAFLRPVVTRSKDEYGWVLLSLLRVRAVQAVPLRLPGPAGGAAARPRLRRPPRAPGGRALPVRLRRGGAARGLRWPGPVQPRRAGERAVLQGKAGTAGRGGRRAAGATEPLGRVRLYWASIRGDRDQTAQPRSQQTGGGGRQPRLGGGLRCQRPGRGHDPRALPGLALSTCLHRGSIAL